MPHTKTQVQTEGGLLGFLDHFQSTFERLHINYSQLRLILKYKLLLDLRDTSIFSQLSQGRQSKKPPKNIFWSFWYYGLYGLVLALLLSIGAPFSRYGYYFLTFFVLLFTSILSGFSSVLLDPHDRSILGVRGVDDRSLNAARLIHIGYYIGIIAILLVGPGVIVQLWHTSILMTLAFILVTLLFTGFTLILSLLLYFTVLHWFNGEKLKNIINVFQVGFMILIYLSGQLPNLIDSLHIGFTLAPVWHWWSILAVPFWFAAPLAGLETGWTTNLLIFTIVAAVGLVLGSFYYYQISGHFEANLAKMAINTNQRPRIGWWQRLTAQLLTRHATQRSYFKLVWRLNQTERDYHLRVYPTIGISFFAVVIVLVNQGIENDGWQAFKNNQWLMLAVYALTLCVPQIVVNLRFSSNPQAGQILRIIPNFQPVVFRTVAIKAVFARLVLPQAILIALVTVPLFGWRILLMELNATLFAYALMAGLSASYLKSNLFSDIFTANQTANLGLINEVFTFFAIGAGVGINALCLLIPVAWNNLVVTGLWIVVIAGISQVDKHFARFT